MHKVTGHILVYQFENGIRARFLRELSDDELATVISKGLPKHWGLLDEEADLTRGEYPILVDATGSCIDPFNILNNHNPNVELTLTSINLWDSTRTARIELVSSKPVWSFVIRHTEYWLRRCAQVYKRYMDKQWGYMLER